MAFDPIIPCLQQITDYARYERFCTDLMRFDGFLGIEPLGGVADCSRDSVLLRNGESVIFHYSVRKDWKTKLWEDAEGVRKHGHPCTRIISVNPADFTTAERDTCIKEFEREFGWPLDLYGVERIAAMLRSNAAPLLKAHPQIFVPHLVEENRSATVDVRVSPTRDKRRQLAQIVAYNRGPGPVLIEGWCANWRVNGLERARESYECYRGKLPVRLDEKTKLDIIVPLDFEWESLEKLGVVDAEKRRYDATDENLKTFVSNARENMPPPPKSSGTELTLEQVQNQRVTIEARRDRPPGSKHDRLIIAFRNHGELPLELDGAAIGWKFDTEKALAKKSDATGPKVARASANTSLRRLSQNAVSSNGTEVLFGLAEEMASMIVEVITRADDITTVEAEVHVAQKFQITETEGVRAVVVAVAESILDSWD